jgi:hypothetical protein
MDAASFTHRMKLAGGNTRMEIGLLVIIALIALAAYWWGNPKHRDQVFKGLFGSDGKLPQGEQPFEF